MSDVATTNLILAVIAGASLMQSLLLVAIVLWTRSHVAALRAQAHALDLPHLAKRAHTALDDFRSIADSASRAGRAVERTADGVHSVVDVAGHEVRRATMGVRTAFDAVGGLARRVAAARAGLKAGVSELMNGGPSERRRTDEAVAVFVSEGGHD